MKVLLVNNLYSPQSVGGAELSVQSLAESLLALGVRVSVLCLSRDGVQASDEVNGVRVHRVPLRNLHWAFGDAPRSTTSRLRWHIKDRQNEAARRDVAGVLESVRPDLVHTHNLAGLSVSTWEAVRDRSLPLVHTLRDYYLLCARSSMFRAREGDVGRSCERRCAACYLLRRGVPSRTPAVGAVVSISEHLWEVHHEHGAFGEGVSQRVIRNGIDPARTGSPMIRSGGVLRVGFIGRLHPSKGIELLLDAARQPELASRVSVLVAGAGAAPYERHLKQLAAGLPVTFAGRMAPAEFYSEVDLVVVPSVWSEPLSRVVPEAHCSGLPVIASTRGGLPELVRVGETGLLFDPAAPGSLAVALRDVLGSREQLVRMGARAKELAIQFAPRRVASANLEVYRGLLGVAR